MLICSGDYLAGEDETEEDSDGQLAATVEMLSYGENTPSVLVSILSVASFDFDNT